MQRVALASPHCSQQCKTGEFALAVPSQHRGLEGAEEGRRRHSGVEEGGWRTGSWASGHGAGGRAQFWYVVMPDPNLCFWADGSQSPPEEAKI